ncbi:MAG: ABC transporter ATP-binding protein [Clostridia bacterium]|nr:ABC transporter ATP-binding protein [Clostridia bacterium]
MLFGKYLNKYYVKHLLALCIGFIALFCVDFAQLKVPEFYRMVVNGLMGEAVVLSDGTQKPFTMDLLLDEICRPLIFVILVLVVGRFVWRICFFGSATKVETELRAEMFDHTKDLSTEYFQENKVGYLMSLFTNDLSTVRECFGVGMMEFADALMLGLLSLSKMARMNLLLTVFSMIPMAIMLFLGTIVSKEMTRKWDIRQEAYSDLSDFAQENFSGIAVIKAFVKETIQLCSFERLNRKNEDANVSYTRTSTLVNIGVTLFVESVICVILGYGGYLVYKGVFNPGMLVEFIGYFSSIVWPVMAISQLIEMQSRGKASLNRIRELLDAKPAVVDRADVETIDALRGEITVKHLTFRYPGAEYDALSDISLHINAGENVAIIGKTGAGKTTLVDLFLRTYNVPDGTIFMDGHDINQIPIRTVRRFSAYVPQDNFLFSDTIANNIAFAAEQTSMEAVENAAKLSDIHENITSFSKQYETTLGERGVTVSGGQKQRISIARALMKDASILILDDSVSAVDTETERIIIQNLKRTRHGKTTILIAHRISTVEQMDKIIVLDNGKLCGIGTHAQLCETCPTYRKMVALQQLDAQKQEFESASVMQDTIVSQNDSAAETEELL